MLCRCITPDFKCDGATDAGDVCTCEAATGVDTCTSFSACVKTPCKRCSDCLEFMANFTKAQEFNQDFAGLKAAFSDYVVAAGFTAQRAQKVLEDPRATLNGLKRASLLCTLLSYDGLVPECNNAGYGFNCTLAPTKTTNTTDGLLNLCTIDGTTAGRDLQGTSSAALPTGTCEEAKDCPRAGDLCNKDLPRDFSKCSPSVGIDTPSKLGLCVLPPKAACEACLIDFAPWVALSTQPDFLAWCTGTANRSATACGRAAQGVASSFRFNAGRRAGAICLLLGECRPVNLTGINLNLTGTLGSFSRCSKEGISSGTALADFPSVLNTTGNCR